jgi:hypothetical protein
MNDPRFPGSFPKLPRFLGFCRILCRGEGKIRKKGLVDALLCLVHQF